MRRLWSCHVAVPCVVAASACAQVYPTKLEFDPNAGVFAD
jgi:hypothetical protein